MSLKPLSKKFGSLSNRFGKDSLKDKIEGKKKKEIKKKEIKKKETKVGVTPLRVKKVKNK